MSPVPRGAKNKKTLLDFGEAMAILINGGQITRPGWGGYFVCLHEHFLCLYNPEDKIFHPWMIADSDLRAEDWVINTAPKTLR